MIKRFLLFSPFILLFACRKEKLPQERYPFLVEAHQVGSIKKGSKVCDLDSIFANDSIVKRIGEGDYMFSDTDLYMVYDTLGKHLLTLFPSEQHDIYAKIENVQIFDERYKTDKDICINSTFSEIKNKYPISSIESTFNDIIFFVDELNASFVIDRKELQDTIQYNLDIEIDTTHISDIAKIKYFMISWE